MKYNDVKIESFEWLIGKIQLIKYKCSDQHCAETKLIQIGYWDVEIKKGFSIASFKDPEDAELFMISKMAQFAKAPWELDALQQYFVEREWPTAHQQNPPEKRTVKA